MVLMPFASLATKRSEAAEGSGAEAAALGSTEPPQPPLAASKASNNVQRTSFFMHISTSVPIYFIQQDRC
jgi:hypothetical protein